MSDIKIFRVDANFIGEKETFDFDAAKKEVLRQFDEWKKQTKNTILSINFGKKHGIYIVDSLHYWYIQVLYE